MSNLRRLSEGDSAYHQEISAEADPSGTGRTPPAENGQRSRAQSDLDSQDPDVRTALLQHELEQCRKELTGIVEEMNTSFKDWQTRQNDQRFVSPPPTKIKRSTQSFDPHHRPPNPAKYKKGRSFDNIFEFTAGAGVEDGKRQRAILRRSGSSTSMSASSVDHFDIHGQASSRRSSGGFSLNRSLSFGAGKSAGGFGKEESPQSFKGNAKGKDRPKWKYKQTIKENQECRAHERSFGADDSMEGVGEDIVSTGTTSRGSGPAARVVSQSRIQQRLEALKKLEERAVEARRGLRSSQNTVVSSPVGTNARAARNPKAEWKIKFSTDEFWVELRSRVRSNSQTESDERRLVLEAREAIERNVPIVKIKAFRFGGGELEVAVREVRALLAEVDGVFETAYPCAHASGVGKHRLPNNIYLERPNSVAFHNPEFSCGSVEDRSTFVSNMEALRAWLSTADAGLAARALLEKMAHEVRWDTPDLDGLLHRVPMSQVTSLILARAKPALEKLHALYRDDVREAKVTIIDHVNPDGTFTLTSQSKTTLFLQQRSYEAQLGPDGMRLPHLATSRGLAGSVAILPVQILLRIVSSRVAHPPNQPNLLRQWWAAGIFQQRFEECIQLLQAGRVYQEELREYAPAAFQRADDTVDKPGPVVMALRDVVGQLETQLREVLYMAFRFCSARKLEVAGCTSRELREACVDLRREEVPRILDALAMFKDTEVAERTAACHCEVLELLLKKGRQLVEESCDAAGPAQSVALDERPSTLEWAIKVDQAASACWSAVRVARAGIGALGLCSELEVANDVKELLFSLYTGGYVWIRPDRSARRDVRTEGKSAVTEEEASSPQHWDHDGRTVLFASPLLFLSSSSFDDEEELGKQRCLALLTASYGVDTRLFEDFGGHLVRIKIPNTAHAEVERLWEPTCSVSMASVADLDKDMEPVAETGLVVLTAPNSYTLDLELKNFFSKVPQEALNVRMTTMPNRRAVRDSVSKVTSELQAMESSISMLVETWTKAWGLLDASEPNAAWNQFPLTVFDEQPAPPTITMVEFSTLQKLFDLATYAASALGSGTPALGEGLSRCRWEVARSWAVTRLAVARDECRNGFSTPADGRADSELFSHHLCSSRNLKVTQERIKYFEEAIKGSVGSLTDKEWDWWLQFLVTLQKEKRDLENTEGRSLSLLAKVVKRSGGGLDARTQKVQELEDRLRSQVEDRVGAGKVQEEQKHMSRMLLKDDKGQRLHWIKLGRLGHGANGEVHRAQFWQSMDFVAVKEIRNNGRSEVISKVERETAVMSKLKHENVVRCYGMESAENRKMYMFIEYCAEGHLRDFVKSWLANGRRSADRSAVPLKIVRTYTMKMARGLEHMHSRGIVHRDIKSLNILVAENGNSVKLSDFGESIEKPEGKSWSDVAPRNAGGTIGHQAPELLRCNKHPTDFGPKIDIWALGCVVTEMLTGQGPESLLWQGPAGDNVLQENLTDITCYFLVHRIAADNPHYLALPFRQVLLALPDDVLEFLDRCFAVRPSLRPTASEVLQESFLCRR